MCIIVNNITFFYTIHVLGIVFSSHVQTQTIKVTHQQHKQSSSHIRFQYWLFILLIWFHSRRFHPKSYFISNYHTFSNLFILFLQLSPDWNKATRPVMSTVQVNTMPGRPRTGPVLRRKKLTNTRCVRQYEQFMRADRWGESANSNWRCLWCGWHCWVVEAVLFNWLKWNILSFS